MSGGRGPGPAATATEALGAFAAGTRAEDLPPAVVELARIRLLDTLGCGLAGRGFETTDRALALAAARAGGGPATYWLSGGRGTVADCGFVNSVLAHTLVHDDVGQGGHPGVNVVPAALAAAEAAGAAGREVLAAVAVGYEVQARIGSGDLLHTVGDRGLRGTTATGAFGAGAAAGRVMGLGAAAMADCLAYCASLCAPGIEEPLLRGSSERCPQTGHNTLSGVLAAELARAGYRGAPTALEGECGFYRGYGFADGMPAAVVERLGEHWVSAGDALVFKPYPTAGWNVGPIWAAEQLVAGERVDPADVAAVRVLHTWWHRNTGYVHPGPFTTVEQALVSCPFAVAAVLLYGRYDRQSVTRGLGDPALDALAARIHVDGVATWGLTDGSVTIVLRDGRALSATADDLPRHLVHPDWSAATDKFRRLTAGVLEPDHAAAVVDAVDGLAEAPETTGLVRLLRV